MVHKPTTILRITTGNLAGRSFITAKNADGSVSFNNKEGGETNITVPTVTKGTFAAGDGGLPTCDEPVIVG